MLAHQRFVLNVAIVTLVATVLLYILVPKGLLPQQDTGVIIGVTDAAENISFSAMMQRVHAVSDIVRKDPDVASVSASVGAGTVNATVNTADFISCSNRTTSGPTRRKSSNDCGMPPSNVEGVSLFMQAAQDVQIDCTRQPHSIPIHLARRRR